MSQCLMMRRVKNRNPFHDVVLEYASYAFVHGC